jgi:hypothetical protein
MPPLRSIVHLSSIKRSTILVTFWVRYFPQPVTTESLTSYAAFTQRWPLGCIQTISAGEKATCPCNSLSAEAHRPKRRPSSARPVTTHSACDVHSSYRFSRSTSGSASSSCVSSILLRGRGWSAGWAHRLCGHIPSRARAPGTSRAGRGRSVPSVEVSGRLLIGLVTSKDLAATITEAGVMTVASR